MQWNLGLCLLTRGLWTADCLSMLLLFYVNIVVLVYVYTNYANKQLWSTCSIILIMDQTSLNTLNDKVF